MKSSRLCGTEIRCLPIYLLTVFVFYATTADLHTHQRKVFCFILLNCSTQIRKKNVCFTNVHPNVPFLSGFPGQFQCKNGTSGRGSACVPSSSKCDSVNDCSDGSDENGCRELGCPGNFQCEDGLCLQRHAVCNGIPDCSDAGDEKDCGKRAVLYCESILCW